MPKTIETYECLFCGISHLDRDLAVTCEHRHITSISKDQIEITVDGKRELFVRAPILSPPQSRSQQEEDDYIHQLIVGSNAG